MPPYLHLSVGWRRRFGALTAAASNTTAAHLFQAGEDEVSHLGQLTQGLRRLLPHLSISGADLYPGPGAFSTSGSGMSKKSGFFDDAESGSGMEKIRIRDKHPGSATLLSRIRLYTKRCACDVEISLLIQKK
jgi:hypothetical protein